MRAAGQWIGLLLGLAVVTVGLDTQAQPTVSAEGGSVAVGGHVTNSTISLGLTPEQVRDTALAIMRQESAAYAQVAELSQRLNVTQQAAVRFFEILGRRQDIPLERLPDTLVEIAQRHRDALARLAALDPADPAVAALTTEAKAAVAVGNYDQADRLLTEAETTDMAAVRMAEELARQAQMAAAQRRLSAAARAERGQVRLTQLDYLGAAEHFRAATELVPAEAHDQRGEYLNRYADALEIYGNEKGDNAALLQAIAIYHRALVDLPHERVPLDWAATQTNLGLDLGMLGERESGMARLEEAVQAYRAALQEYTRERVPLQWAGAQTGLGAALCGLGERESDTTRLEQAVEAFRAALQEYTRERVPLDWATTQNNLGSALMTLGEQESDTARLEEAVEAYRATLLEWTRERVPLDWATTQSSLCYTLAVLGDLQRNIDHMREAEAMIRSALTEITREDNPQIWANTQDSLGFSLTILGEQDRDLAKLNEAISIFHFTLEILLSGDSTLIQVITQHLHRSEGVIQL